MAIAFDKLKGFGKVLVSARCRPIKADGRARTVLSQRGPQRDTDCLQYLARKLRDPEDRAESVTHYRILAAGRPRD